MSTARCSAAGNSFDLLEALHEACAVRGGMVWVIGASPSSSSVVITRECAAHREHHTDFRFLAREARVNPQMTSSGGGQGAWRWEPLSIVPVWNDRGQADLFYFAEAGAAPYCRTVGVTQRCVRGSFPFG